MEYEQITLDNSPIQFVLVGPMGGQDKILLRSKDVGLELIGIASSKDFMDASITYPKPIFPYFSKSTNQLNVVVSDKVSDIKPELDDRNSSFRLAWRGNSSPSGIMRVKKALDYSITDLIKAIKKNNVVDVEFEFSAVILECLLLNENVKSRRRTYLWIIIITTILYSIIGVYAFYRNKL